VLPRLAAADQYPTAAIAQDTDDNVDSRGTGGAFAQLRLPWHCLYFLPEPHGHG
jgi:hypothetical protein